MVKPAVNNNSSSRRTSNGRSSPGVKRGGNAANNCRSSSSSSSLLHRRIIFALPVVLTVIVVWFESKGLSEYFLHYDNRLEFEERDYTNPVNEAWFSSSSSSSSLPKQQQQESVASSSIPSFLSEHYDVCVVGAGLSGAVIAERYASVLKKRVLVLEKRSHIGGNCYDYIDGETNIRVSKYGAHLFHTNNERVWKYVQDFTDWTKYEHKVLGLVNGQHVPIPVNIETVNMLFNTTISNSEEMDAWLQKEQVTFAHDPANSEEMALSRVGPRLYELIFKPYTFKQWARYPAELGPEVTARIPVRNNYDGRYFGDKYQALPTNGYTAMFENLLNHPLITIRTHVDYFQIRHALNCDRLYYTGPIDTYFAHLGWPKLEYRSLDFERVVKKNTTFFQPMSVVNHPQPNDDYTRIVEYKHILNQTSPHTVYFIERSKDGGEPYYPVPNTRNQDLYRRYQNMAAKENGVTFVGRLANYKYFNMDQAILNALELFDKDTAPLRKTHWCVITKKSMKISPKWFVHFPHCAEVLLPCWSWFRRMNAEKNCGFVLMDGLKFNPQNGQGDKRTWQKQLVDAMGCQVKELDQPIPPDFKPLKPDNDGEEEIIQHVPNLQLLRPRFNHRVYIERPEDAHALRRLVVSDDTIDKAKGHDKPLQIGLIQRTRTRAISNLPDIQKGLQQALPNANVTITTLNYPRMADQAEWFATKDVIIAAHGAALTNAVFITPGTLVLQVYPVNYFFQSLDPLIEQSGGIALDWFHGSSPVEDWLNSRAKGKQNKMRESSVAPPVEEIVEKVLGGLGEIRVTTEMLKGW